MTKVLSNVMLEQHSVRMESSNVIENMGTTECDKRTVICDVGTVQCEAGTINCKEKKKEPLNVTKVQSHVMLELRFVRLVP